jgi:nucleotide-binding universal stress UspA family protein
MQTLRHLVAGTDFSVDADRAVELAVELAVAAAAPLTLVHVCEDDDARLRECERALARMVEQLRLRGADVNGVLRSGRPWEKLANVAVEVGATLIVVGRGPVADRLVRSGCRPVLTVPNDSDT